MLSAIVILLAAEDVKLEPRRGRLLDHQELELAPVEALTVEQLELETARTEGARWIWPAVTLIVVGGVPTIMGLTFAAIEGSAAAHSLGTFSGAYATGLMYFFLLVAAGAAVVGGTGAAPSPSCC